MAWHGPLKQLDDNRFEIGAGYQSDAMKRQNVTMRVPGVIYANKHMIGQITSDDSPDQVAHVATLPGILGASFAMPDIHHGYGFAIGGVAAFDAEEGIISPGGVGYDINCGVRLIRTSLDFTDIRNDISRLVDAMFVNIPSGVGAGGKRKLSDKEVNAVLEHGAQWAVNEGYGWNSDGRKRRDCGS
jgi:tRNA-splicing ligase RtcB